MNRIRTRPLDATFGAVVTGVKLAEMDDKTFRTLYETWLQYALLIFPEQHLSRAQQIAFASRFGELEIKLAELSNVRDDGSLRPDDGTDDMVKILKGNMGWHMDSTYMPVQAKGAVFSAGVVPSTGGETGWADTRDAWRSLEDCMKERLESLSAFHSLYYSQAKMGHTPGDDSAYSGYGFHDQEPPLRPLVKVHPETGEKALVIGRHAYGIPGLDPDASEALLAELLEFTCRESRVWYHRWQPGDVVLWDNRCLLHRACPWDMNEPRVMFHSRIAGSKDSESAPPAQVGTGISPLPA